jgi:hypothetical protein
VKEDLYVEAMLTALDCSVVCLPEAARPEALHGLLAFYAALHQNAGVAVPLWVRAEQARDASARRLDLILCSSATSVG